MAKYMTAFIFYTLAMIGVVVIAYVVWKNSVIMAVNKKKGLMQVEESLSLAPRKTLHIIKIGGERFLIAADADKTTFLAKLGEAETIKNVQKYIENKETIEENEPEKKSQAGEVETFSMRKLLSKLANEGVREEEWM